MGYTGWCPPSGRAEDGYFPLHVGLIPTPFERSPMAPGIPRSLRTEWNVRMAHAVLVLHMDTQPLGAGTYWTLQAAELYRKPYALINLRQPGAIHMAQAFLQTHKPHKLMVAGPAQSQGPGIEALAFIFLTAVLNQAGGANLPLLLNCWYLNYGQAKEICINTSSGAQAKRW